MREKGFTVTELLIMIAVIGILSVIVIPQFFGIGQAATTVKCAANLYGFSEEIELIWLDSAAPSQAELEARGIGWPNGKWKDYWYLPNNSDFNKGHGNDLDGCDEENPGASFANRECIAMRFLIVCKHESHGVESDAKYLFVTNFYAPMIVAKTEDARKLYLMDAKWWPGKDPGFDKWIGRIPTT